MKRFFKAVLIAFALVLLLAAVAVSSFPRYVETFFTIRSVELSGEIDHISSLHFRRVLGNTASGTFFNVNLDAIREAALKAPWVKSANVRRVWPNKINIEITEYKPLALWEDGRLVSVNGELFAANPEEVDNPLALPEFFGRAEMVEEVTRRYKRFNKMLQVVMPKARVTEVSVNDRDSWALAIASDTIPPTRIELGVEHENWTLEDRFGIVIVQYPDVVKLMKGPPSSIDARYELAFSATLPEKSLRQYRSQAGRRQAAESIAEANRQSNAR
ncbi:FtsQ-type POTRA domain-containing protein [Parasutterella secunda]|jgi:cell division protein FtsQ|uniref:cell division protein FtsQ/DivIB n=1 Tax=Parasutterella secunda TaxID=626947 RepID=UPI002011076F|nr:FtsQ-type POTRA domain-containing protein [Parasutterella secunda]MCL1596833.1 FtsQ-type POTRA domain-containing protein [Parasutterella secunda]MDM8087867.1 FtsQ-type POTRA domain-containing protein [Parasutterella secunda]